MIGRKPIALVVAVALGLAGCGGGSDKENGEHEAGAEVEHAQEQALDQVPEADRSAFIVLATAIGTVRARAAPVAVGTGTTLASASPLRAASNQVAALHPSAPELIQVRKRLVPLLASFAHAPVSGPAARRAARHAIAAADRIEPGLRAYTQTQPAIGGAIPD